MRTRKPLGKMSPTTKEEFLDTLCNHKSVFISNSIMPDKKGLERVLPRLDNFEIRGLKSAKIKKQFSNSLSFTDGSRLSLRDVGACFAYNGYILSRRKIIYHQYGRRDKVEYIYLIYWILY